VDRVNSQIKDVERIIEKEAEGLDRAREKLHEATNGGAMQDARPHVSGGDRGLAVSHSRERTTAGRTEETEKGGSKFWNTVTPRAIATANTDLGSGAAEADEKVGTTAQANQEALYRKSEKPPEDHGGEELVEGQEDDVIY
jgi:hypothetical protein